MRDEHGVPHPVAIEELDELQKEWVPIITMVDQIERNSTSTRAETLATPAKYGAIVNLLGLDKASRDRRNLIEMTQSIFGTGK